MIIVESNNLHYGFNKKIGDKLIIIPFLNVESAQSASENIVKERGEGVYQGEVVDIQEKAKNVGSIADFIKELIDGRPFEFEDSGYKGVIIVNTEDSCGNLRIAYVIEYLDRYEAAFVREGIRRCKTK